MAVLITCRFEDDSIESEGAILRTTFSLNKSMEKNLVAQGRVTPK